MFTNLQGSLWALLAACLLSIGVAMSKHSALAFHVSQILFFRQLKTRHPGLHLIRLTGAFTALRGGIWAVTVPPLSTALSTAVTLGFAQVCLVTLPAAC